MLKNKKTPAKKVGETFPKRHLTILYTSLITLAAVCLFMGAYIKWLHDTIKSNDYTTTQQFIKNAIYDTYRPAIINPQDKKQYIHEANVRFPDPEQGYKTFRYTYTPASDNFKAAIEITTLGILRAGYNQLQSEKTPFENVPLFQRCSRLFLVQFAPGVDIGYSFKELGSKKLADGRTAYLYRNDSCDDMFKALRIDTSDLETTLRQIESY